uniref:G_PROTEIN_RECEP_F1_2 domain-containing protein n=1 Tax=Meloidogyne hapla TaxID=6305 RepID=A0A1I8B5L4_MELHA
MSIQKQTLFDVYGDKGLPTDLIAINVFRIAIATIGIFLNASVVYVTFKCKTLKSPCHFLLAFECFSNAIFQLHSWLSMTVLFSVGHQFVNIRFCCQQLILIFIIGFSASFTAALLVSFDRLLSVLFPLCQVICAPHECVWGWAGDLSYFIFSAINFLTLVNYIIIWIVLKCHAVNNQNQG